MTSISIEYEHKMSGEHDKILFEKERILTIKLIFNTHVLDKLRIRIMPNNFLIVLTFKIGVYCDVLVCIFITLWTMSYLGNVIFNQWWGQST